MFQAELRVASGKQTGSLISLPPGKFLIGREEDCHLRPNSELVSRHHCVFLTDEYAVRLRDLGSTNGTFVNGEQVKGSMNLQHGDRVSVGKLEFEVVMRDPAMEDTSMELSQETQTGLPTGNVLADEPPAEGSDGSTVEPSTSATMMEMPVAPAMGYDLMGGQPGMAPPGMYGQPPLGFPPQYPQYGYPGYPMPGYYPQMGYPQMPGYPGVPQMPPMQQAPPQTTAPASNDPGVRLPDPETTGAKPPEPPKPVAEDAKSGDKPASIPDTVADIIKQYRTRRPSS
jgi:pSer/pThr/pTyr-binding forkhead associated (FHA) protein